MAVAVAYSGTAYDHLLAKKKTKEKNTVHTPTVIKLLSNVLWTDISSIINLTCNLGIGQFSDAMGQEGVRLLISTCKH